MDPARLLSPLVQRKQSAEKCLTKQVKRTDDGFAAVV